MSERVHHPIFARLFTHFAAKAEPHQAKHREEVLAGLSGRVVEVGAGSGLNFGHYPESVTEIVAVEPEPYLRGVATRAASDAAVPVTVVDGVAGKLPLEDSSVDAGIVSLVLCSVPDQARALAELRRVIRPGGELRFYEHVLSTDPRLARTQRVARRFWPLLGGGCHPDRDTVAAISEAGFQIEQCRRFHFMPSPLLQPVKPHVIGVARNPLD